MNRRGNESASVIVNGDLRGWVGVVGVGALGLGGGGVFLELHDEAAASWVHFCAEVGVDRGGGVGGGGGGDGVGDGDGCGGCGCRG